MDEHNHQKLTVAWARAQGLTIFAIPNGGSRDPITARRLKDEGVLSGVPDLFLAHSCGGMGGLFIEMKQPLGRVSKAQEAMINTLATLGYAAVVCYGYEAAKEAINGYIGRGASASVRDSVRLPVADAGRAAEISVGCGEASRGRASAGARTGGEE